LEGVKKTFSGGGAEGLESRTGLFLTRGAGGREEGVEDEEDEEDEE